jgi:hypothetical protein
MGKQFFTGERRDFLFGFIDQHKAHKKAGTVEDFWPIIIPAYFTKFPEDNLDEVTAKTGQAPKTKCGRPSKKRGPDQPKPIREVWFCLTQCKFPL